MHREFEFSSVSNEELLHDVSEQDRIEDWDEYFLAFAFLAARKSKDPSTKTGAVVVRDRQILTTGYNSFARGCDDDPALYENREYKYANIVHCDHNAVLQAARVGISLMRATMYLTGPPCSSCTQSIINAGIAEVVWPQANKFECTADTASRWDEDLLQAQTNLKEGGVKFRRWAGAETEFRVDYCREGRAPSAMWITAVDKDTATLQAEAHLGENAVILRVEPESYGDQG